MITPSSMIDIFDDAVLADPYPAYRQLRDRGDVVFSEPLDMWLAARYDSVRSILSRNEIFSSAEGVGFDTDLNALRKGGVIASDPPDHTRLRKVLSDQLGPSHLRHLSDQMQQQADVLIDSLIERGSFDGVADLAARFPVDVVTDLIGLPAEGREHLLSWAAGAFDTFGVRNQRTEDGLGSYFQIRDYIERSLSRDTLAPDSMGMAVFNAVDEGQISEQEAVNLLPAYLIAGMDTTVNSVGHALWLLGSHPEQWQALRAGSVSIPNAISETLRYESPVYAFSRHVTCDADFESARVPAGSRIGVLFGSANRDERKWQDPDRFDVGRKSASHVAFGYGIHSCAGQGLARLETQTILAALVSKVKYIEVANPTRRLNNIIRGLAGLEVRLVPA